MAKFAFTTENFCCFPRHTNSLFNCNSLKKRQLLILSSKQRPHLRFFSAIGGKESVTETEKVVTGLRVDELDNSASVSDAEDQREGGEVGFDWQWPPWKNIPQRYKLIGTTSLAFVICNMDKVNLSVAIIPMSHQFGWNSSTAGLVQSSFFWGYALSQLPGGWLAKIIGGRKVLEIGVLTWSLATALVPILAGFMPGLILSRILVNTIGRTLKSCSICFWWFKCRKCCRASFGSSTYPKLQLGSCLLYIWHFRDRLVLGISVCQRRTTFICV